MCGIFAVAGSSDAAKDIFKGLRRLDYRGYDSWGITIKAKNQLITTKQTGIITFCQQIKDLPKSSIGIGHTRWATRGGVTKINAHPHYSTNRSFALAHNGIVENYQQLKNALLKDKFKFITQTDTEVIVRLIEREQKKAKDLATAVRQAFSQLVGRNTIILLTQSGKIIAARNGSPLVIGISDTTQLVYFSSDTLSFAPFAQQMVVVDNGHLVIYQNKTISIISLKTGRKIPFRVEKTQIKVTQVAKNGFDHFMIKEIYETPLTLQQVIRQDKEKITTLANAIKRAQRVYTIGSGTAGLAAAQIAYYLRTYGQIPAISLIGAEAQSFYHLFSKDDIIIAPSQSGETADVIEVLEIAKEKGVRIATYINMAGSVMTRMSDYPFFAQAGPEICVMSTKIFTSQIAWGYLVAKTVSHHYSAAKTNLKNLSHAIADYLDNEKNHTLIKRLAKKLIKSPNIFLLGKSQNLAIVQEGMVKIIEGTYKHAHSLPAGDLKHYAITLIEKSIPVIVVLSNDQARLDVLNSASEVKTRGAVVIALAPQNSPDFDYYLSIPDTQETSALMNIIPLQLLAYYMAVRLGHNVDKPRNIAKSVTVK